MQGSVAGEESEMGGGGIGAETAQMLGLPRPAAGLSGPGPVMVKKTGGGDRAFRFPVIPSFVSQFTSF